MLHEEKGITGPSQKTLFSWALGGVFTWQVTAYNRQGGIIGQSLFPPEKRPVFLLGQPSRPPVLWSLMVGGETGNGRLRNLKKTFLRTDESVVVWQEWANVRGEHVVVARFYNPLGQQYHEIRSIIRPSSLKTGQWINIAGHRAAEIPGQWKVEIWVDNQLLRTETFEEEAENRRRRLPGHRQTPPVVENQSYLDDHSRIPAKKPPKLGGQPRQDVQPPGNNKQKDGQRVVAVSRNPAQGIHRRSWSPCPWSNWWANSKWKNN
ncbi:MAG: hypothetical protein M1379_05710 [Firmicutes bacterium]|nr:hypothetical protein [Bacillota bacterium]